MTGSIQASELIVVGGHLNWHDDTNVNGYNGQSPSKGNIHSKM